MTKKKTIHMIPVKRTQGFTLIEMLVVAALIAIFAGLAVFNIVEQLNREKEKAAIAEARSLATGMSFAYDDLGFFPRLCFLRFGKEELIKVITDETLGDDAIEYHGYSNPTMANMIRKNWGDKYMGGTMPEKAVRVAFPSSTGIKEFDWPADPFRRPYVAYLIKIESPTTGGTPQPQWLERFGDKPNYFAGIVSYGRNGVPGLTWDTTDQGILDTRRNDGSLFVPRPGGTAREFNLPGPPPGGNYSAAALDILVNNNTDVNLPNIRQAGSDDKFFEF